MDTTALLTILAFTLAAIGGSWHYFRRYQVTRPPIGVLNLHDIALMIGAIIAVPYLYLWLPPWLVVVLLTLGTWSLLALLFEPVLRVRLAVQGVSMALVTGNLAAAYLWGTAGRGYLLINNLILVLTVVSITNLWAQSGLRARDVTLLGAALIGYDFVATAVLPLMDALFVRMMALPFGTQIAWPAGAGLAGLGLGDLLLAAVFPLVMRKAFGAQAGWIALALAVSVLVGLFLLPITGTFPVMVVLGPAMIGQYLWWRYRTGGERTTWRYLQEEPVVG
jgi:hypothetical protein